MTFQQVINRLFREQCENKKKFAKMIGISPMTLYNYMEGITEPSFSDAKRIIEASGTKDLVIIEKFQKEKEE